MAKFTDQLQAFSDLALRLASLHNADAVLFLLVRATDWKKLHKAVSNSANADTTFVIAGDTAEVVEGAADQGFDTLVLNMPDAPMYERLTQALLEGVAEEYFPEGASVVTAYSGFESGAVDSLSLIRLDDHLGRLTVRDLRQLQTKIPEKTLKMVVDLAVEIGREGREGKPVGTLFVVGDHRKCLDYCHSMGFDPVRGYNRADRNLSDLKVREGVKEIAQLDGAFLVSADGTVVAACQHISAPPDPDLALTKGLGARHWAAAEISKATSAIAISVSETNGTVRLLQNGEVVLRIEPFRLAMKWKAFDADGS